MPTDPTAHMSPEEAAAYAEALRKIDECRKSGKTGLDLSLMPLSTLPPEIGHLRALTELNLNQNRLTTLPPAIGLLAALRVLHLSHNQLSILPPEIGQLSQLTKLDLDQNKLSTLPPEIGQLTALTVLNLNRNQLSTLPPEIGQLTTLTELYLYNNELSTLPQEIGQLNALTELNLSNNQLSILPPEIGQLTALTWLDVYYNQLSTLPPEISKLTTLRGLFLNTNQLSTFPPEIGQLTTLTKLDLQSNQLSTLPPEIGKLTALTELYLYNNKLSTLPPEISQLTALTQLNLSNNQLSILPQEIGQLTALTELDLQSNQLSTLPPEIGKLTTLKQLQLHSNRLTTLPSEIGKLTALTELFLHSNQLKTIPSEIGLLSSLTALTIFDNKLISIPKEISQLSALRLLSLHDNQLISIPAEIGLLNPLTQLQLFNNPLEDPPNSICNQGLDAVRQYFADKATTGEETLWRSKLMLVGEGRVGKTELRHRLLGRPHGQAKTTEVLEIETVPLPHPTLPEVTMSLNCWDFGGQEVYHATHQFFLTGRSLFVYCFEAGKDWEAGRPYYWLDKISAVAPEAPVVIVATKGDERAAPALPWTDLKQRYSQLIGDGCFLITTRTSERKDQPGDGMAELLACLQHVAADRSLLPLMGESLPKAWVAGMKAVEQHPHDHYLKQEVFCNLLEKAGVPTASLHTVATMLRDLGEILYYSEETDAELQDWVIIKPSWVTRAAARILDSAGVQASTGVLTKEEMKQAWHGYPEVMHPVLLDLMEKYDLTYKIPEDASDRSLVVEQLPKSEVSAPTEWDALKPGTGLGNHEMEMTFHLASMQAGIPTWFIARKHYYTMRKHWRYGVFFADNREHPKHVALVRASTDPKEPVVRLTVRGPFPQTFFAVMKEGLEASIRDRYPQLIKQQTIPCCCQDRTPGAQPCTHAFNYERLLERLAKKKEKAECDVSLEEVSVTELLFGYDAPVNATIQRVEEMEERLAAKIEEVGDKLEEIADAIRQNFRYLYSDLQRREETHCPNLFVIWREAKGKPFHVPMRLALCCQHPREEHIACELEKAYHIDALKDFVRKAAPLLKSVKTVLKYAKLTGLPIVKEWDKDLGELVGNCQETMNSMLEDFEKISDKGEAPELFKAEIDQGDGQLQEKRIAGAALREFRALLDKVDKTQSWHGLVKKRSNLTGEYLWVCAKHAAEDVYHMK